ncbi:hypothetical protein FDG42_04760 [Clostridium botulinum]|nr:DUF4355 domain-containing protein [Clostridium botulinum]MBZ1332310.1 DUF4355 domain-containing protein [Clostridium botulinum]MBZ1336326.1 DUF4355 domain-containing protein [Clostridium botulinum]MBZ1338577.1 DUF4355 domain-containing protein [Clostridium botulinum]MBZ1343567.1 DUF4355 domain-containing protein [Clostridium botulinum]
MTQEQEVKTDVQEKEEIKVFTEEELNKKLQSETDRVRTEYSKKLKEMENKIKELTPVEKSQAELDMEARIKALEDKEKEVQAKEIQLKVSKTLSDNGLPSQLSKYLNTTGVEDVESYLGEVKEVLTEHINNTALNNSFKPQNHSNAKEVISKEEFKNMNYIERQKLYKTNQELYKKLSK